MTRPTRAIVLAAGRGTRLGALTATRAKPMLEVGGEPILHRILRGLAAAGVREALVVTGHGAGELEAATGDGSALGIAVTYRRQAVAEGTARAVQLGREFAGEEPFLVAWGDILVEPANYEHVLAAAAESEGALAVNFVDDPATGGAVYADDDGFVTRLVEKPPRGTSTTNWNNAGLLALPAAIWPYIEGVPVSTRGEYELPQAVAAFIGDGARLRAVPVQGPWFDIGTPENLAAARQHFAGPRR